MPSLTPPKLRCLFFTGSSFLLLPLATLAQFTGIALLPESNADTARVSLSVTVDFLSHGDGAKREDAFDGSFGTLDLGFGTYLAPRSPSPQRVLALIGAPLSRPYSATFLLAGVTYYVTGGPSSAAGLSGTAASLVRPPQTWLLAVAAPEGLAPDRGAVGHPFGRGRFGWGSGAGFPF